MQNQTVSHTTDDLQNTQTWQDRLLNHSSDYDSDIEDLEGDFLEGKNINNTYYYPISLVPNFFSFLE